MTQLILNIESTATANILLSIIKRIKGVHIVPNTLVCADETEDFIAKFSGAWNSDESAEKIIADIQESANCRPPISFE